MKVRKDIYSKIRGKFRYGDISAQAEKIDKKLNFPKMITGLAMSGLAIGIKIAIPIVPFMDVLFVAGITTATAGLGIKLDRVKKGGKFWEHEKRIFENITKGK